MAQTSKPDIIRAIFAAYLANDRARVDDALADDFHFTSPHDDNIDKPIYFERCWNNTDWIARHELERILVEGEEAFVTYRCIARDKSPQPPAVFRDFWTLAYQAIGD